MTHKGTVIIAPDIILYNVYYVPNFHFNFISVTQFALASFCALTFTPYSCVIQALLSLRKIASAKVHQGLYYLDTTFQSNSSLSKTCNVLSFPNYNSTSISQTLSDDLLWHYRFGHVSAPRLQLSKHVCPSIHIPKHHNCVVCPIAKQRKLPFPHSSTVSASCFDLIHMDIWGPFRTPTIHGHQYF